MTRTKAVSTPRKPAASNIDVAIGARIRAARLARKPRMSQGELGTELGVTFQQIQKYEKGINRVAGSRLLRMCEVLRMKPEALLGITNGAGGHYNNPDALAVLHDRHMTRMIIALNALPAERRHGVADAVIAMVRAFGGKI